MTHSLKDYPAHTGYITIDTLIADLKSALAEIERLRGALEHIRNHVALPFGSANQNLLMQITQQALSANKGVV